MYGHYQLSKTYRIVGMTEREFCDRWIGQHFPPLVVDDPTNAALAFEDAGELP